MHRESILVQIPSKGDKACNAAQIRRRQPVQPGPGRSAHPSRLSGILAWVQFVCLSCNLLLAEVPRAGVARGSGRGALNAGRAWIIGGGAVDGFGQSWFQFSGVVLRGPFLFYRSPVICEQMQA